MSNTVPYFPVDSRLTELPSTRFFSDRGRMSPFDVREPDVSDVDFNDICTDIDILEYYYGWTKRGHWKKYGHPWVLADDIALFHLKEPLPLDKPYELAQREDHVIQAMIYAECPMRPMMKKSEFEKWKNEVLFGEIDEDKPLREIISVMPKCKTRNQWRFKRTKHDGYRTIDDLEDLFLFEGSGSL